MSESDTLVLFVHKYYDSVHVSTIRRLEESFEVEAFKSAQELAEKVTEVSPFTCVVIGSSVPGRRGSDVCVSGLDIALQLSSTVPVVLLAEEEDDYVEALARIKDDKSITVLHEEGLNMTRLLRSIETVFGA